MSKFLFATAAFAALLAPALAASVTIDGMTPTLGGDLILKRVVVNYSLNPADAKDAAVLYAQIDTAAQHLCASNPGGAGGLLADKVEKCRVQAVKAAVKAIDSPALAAAAAK